MFSPASFSLIILWELIDENPVINAVQQNFMQQWKFICAVQYGNHLLQMAIEYLKYG